MTIAEGAASGEDPGEEEEESSMVSVRESSAVWRRSNSRSLLSRVIEMRTLGDIVSSNVYLYEMMVSNGRKWTWIVVLGLYSTILVMWVPLWMMSFMITEVGVYMMMVIVVAGLGRSVLRLITFPGACFRVYGEIEREFSRYSLRMLDAALSCVVEFCDVLNDVNDSSGSNLEEVEGMRDKAWTYHDSVLAMYHRVLLCLLHHGGYDSQTGSHPLQGHIGDLRDVSEDGKEHAELIVMLLSRLLQQMAQLHPFIHPLPPSILPQSAIDALSATHSTATALKDVTLNTLAQLTPTNANQQPQTDNSSPLHPTSFQKALQSSLSSLSPLFYPPLHTNVFGIDLLRGSLLTKFPNSQQIYIPRTPQSGFIDAIFIPSNHTNTNTNTNHQRSIALYCNPNAGLYEVSTGMNFDQQQHQQSSWTLFYLNHGFDVLLFNYAGFGRSTFNSTNHQPNTPRHSPNNPPSNIALLSKVLSYIFLANKPSPASLKHDAFSVAQYLLNTLNYQTILIHGESIGGMVAASVANVLSSKPLPTSNNSSSHYSNNDDDITTSLITPTNNPISGENPNQYPKPPPVSLLICDRTFCNLEATAQYLLGSWCGPVIRLLTPLWNTNVARDYLAAKCPKIVATDAADIIISDPSSLKAGIAYSKEFKCGTMKLGWKCTPPIQYRMSDWENVPVGLSQYAPLKQNPPPVWPVDKHISLQEAYHFAACAKRIAKIASKARHAIQRTPSPSSQSSDDSAQETGVELLLDASSFHGLEHPNRSSHTILSATVNHETTSFIDSSSPSTNNNATNNLSSVAAIPFTTNQALLLMETWNTLASCNGLCGSPLGHAVKDGFQCTVSWLCCALIYGAQRVAYAAEQRTSSTEDLNIIPADFDLKSPCVHYTEKYEDEEDDSSGLRIHPLSICVVKEKLKALIIQHCATQGALKCIEQELRYCHEILEYIINRISSKIIVKASLDSKHFRDAYYDSASSSIGSFMNLHCGHNSQYSYEEKQHLIYLIRESHQFVQSRIEERNDENYALNI